MRSWRIAAAALAVAASAGAQVGHEPARSPYVDVEYRQELGLLAGSYSAKKDAAGVAPQSGPLFGVRYGWRAGGPAHITGEIAYIDSKRTILDPRQPVATRNLGERSWPLYSADVSLALSLTGPRSYRGVVPMVKAGVGFVSDFKRKADEGDFRFGTRFAFSWGGGVRWVAGGRWSVRADVNNRMYTIAYPDLYYSPPVPPGGNPVPPILASNVDKSRWTNNTALTLGISYLFSR